MLNYWRTTAGGAATFFAGNTRPHTNNTLLPAAAPFSDYGFDGPFFDLEFTLFNDEANENGNSSETEEEMREIELDLNFNDQDFKISPIYENSLEEDAIAPASMMKSLSMLKKSNVVGEKSEKSKATDDNRLVRVKFKVDQLKGPLISLFARDISFSQDSSTSPAILGKEMLQKYLNILKPLYMRLHGGSSAVSPPPPMAKAGARNNNLQAARKHLAKSRSTSAAAAVSPPGSSRRDDSLLELQDGIQGAILHCKRSFNSERGEAATFSRSVTVPYTDKSVIDSASNLGKTIETGV